jgi:hypothetical protein
MVQNAGGSRLLRAVWPMWPLLPLTLQFLIFYVPSQTLPDSGLPMVNYWTTLATRYLAMRRRRYMQGRSMATRRRAGTPGLDP